MGRHHPCLIAVMTLAFLLSLGADAFGTRPSSPRSLADTTQRTKPNQLAPPSEVDRKTEAAALKLVQDHLPELKGVLHRLRADEPRQYNRAISDLARSAKRLEVAKNRDVALFEIEAETLKAQNAVSLLTAKLKVRDNESDRQLLRRAAVRLQQAQIARAQYDVDSLQARLRRTKQQLESAQQRLDGRREELDHDSEKSYLAALKRAGRQPVSDSVRRPAADPSPIKGPAGQKRQTD
jgi:hypothetical protein